MPLEATYICTASFLTVSNTNMAAMQTSEVEATLAPLNVGSRNFMW
jgi:hypothetical protein